MKGTVLWKASEAILNHRGWRVCGEVTQALGVTTSDMLLYWLITEHVPALEVVSCPDATCLALLNSSYTQATVIT